MTLGPTAEGQTNVAVKKAYSISETAYRQIEHKRNAQEKEQDT